MAIKRLTLAQFQSKERPTFVAKKTTTTKLQPDKRSLAMAKEGFKDDEF